LILNLGNDFPKKSKPAALSTAGFALAATA